MPRAGVSVPVGAQTGPPFVHERGAGSGGAAAAGPALAVLFD